MRRFLIFACMMALTGCAWLGFGDDATTTASEETQASADISAESQAPEVEAPKTTQASTAKKSAKTTKNAKNEAQIKAALDERAKKLVAQSARTIMPNKAHPEYKKVGGEWVASFVDVDTNHVVTEMSPGVKVPYVGKIRYQERYMECRGATKEAALKGNCQQVRTSTRTEMISYDGKAWD